MRRVRWLDLRLLLIGTLLALTLILVLPAGVWAEGPVMDGQFADWSGYGSITDPAGDGPTPNTDITLISWASVVGWDRIAFMIVRTPPNSNNPRVFYNVYIDANNNGNAGDGDDRRIAVLYDPQQTTSQVIVTVFSGSGGQISQRSGDWGQSVAEGGAQVEFVVSFADLGVFSHQTISMYISAGATETGGNLDRAPDSGTITWAPIPALGWPLLMVLFLGAVVLVWRTRGRRAWANT